MYYISLLHVVNVVWQSSLAVMEEEEEEDDLVSVFLSDAGSGIRRATAQRGKCLCLEDVPIISSPESER